MAVLDAYRRVLRNPALSRLLFGEFVSSVGDWLYLVALLVVVYAEAGDPVVLGIIGAARVLPYVLLSVPAGIAADRFDRRLILIVTDVSRGLIMILIALAVLVQAPVAVIVALAIFATCFSAFFSPAIGALLPSLARDESELGPANSAWSSLSNLAFFVGPALAALLLAVGGMVLAFLINALTFAVVAVVLWRLPVGARRHPAQAVGEAAADGAAAAAPGLRATLAPVVRPLVGLGLINIAGGLVFGGLGMLTVILAVDYFDVGEAGTGLFNSAIGVGGVLGALVAGALVLRRRLGPPMLIGAVAIGASIALLGFVPPDMFAVAMVAMAVASGGALLVEIVSTTLFQRIVPDALRGRTLGVLDTVYVLAYAAGSLLVPLAAAGDPIGPLLALGALMIVAGLLAVVLLGRFGVQEFAVDDARRRLADVPLFAGLPPAALEQAMRAAHVVTVMAGTVVIRQGEPADRFYVLADGEVEVTQVPAAGEPARVLRRMGAGEFFGEIGLLSNVPRTATVTALSDADLVALDAEPFLELVGQGPGLTYRLLDLHRGATSSATG